MSDEIKPVAWLHTLHMELDQKTSRLSFDEASPFGVAGVDYDPSYLVSSEALIALPPEWSTVTRVAYRIGFDQALPKAPKPTEAETPTSPLCAPVCWAFRRKEDGFVMNTYRERGDAAEDFALRSSSWQAGWEIVPLGVIEDGPTPVGYAIADNIEALARGFDILISPKPEPKHNRTVPVYVEQTPVGASAPVGYTEPADVVALAKGYAVMLVPKPEPENGRVVPVYAARGSVHAA